MLSLLTQICPLSVFAQRGRNSANTPGVTPPPPPRRNPPPSATPPPATQGAPGANLPPPNAVPAPTPNSNNRTGPRSRIVGGPNFPCADCDEGSGYTPPNDPNYSTERTALRNEKGRDGVTLGSRNYNWSMNLVHLAGRAGMDLDIPLSYNSLVWVKQAEGIKFNADKGWPAPGFEMGWPTVETAVDGSVFPPAGVPSAYLVTWPNGGHTRLPWASQDTSCQATYASTDGSNMKFTRIVPPCSNYLYLSVNGTTFNFVPQTLYNNTTRFVANEITDRNGNRHQITYDNYAHPLSVTDTNGRVVNFVYDNDHNLTQITQQRSNGTFIWAEFFYKMWTLNPTFAAGVQVNMPSNPSVTVLDKVKLPDGSYYQFDYNRYGQAVQFTRYAPNDQAMAYTWYDAAHNWIPDDPPPPASRLSAFHRAPRLGAGLEQRPAC